MKIDEKISGVLNYEQLEKLCSKFELNIDQLHANFDGWRKLVLFTEDKIFMFPRDPSGIEWLEREATALEMMSKHANLPVPNFIQKVKDEEISYYEFLITSRLEGTAYSKFEDEINKNEVHKLLKELARTFTLWHNLDISKVSKKIPIKKYKMDKGISIDNWEQAIFNPKFTEDALIYFQGVLDYWGCKSKFKGTRDFLSITTLRKWKERIFEIVNLDHVLIHGDIHEDQILLKSKDNMKITGIIDWETVRIDNPFWEFNFFEWGLKIWEWREHFSEFRNDMWEIYLNERDISLKHIDGLDLLYVMIEFLSILKYPDKERYAITGLNKDDSIIFYLNKLHDLTEKMKE